MDARSAGDEVGRSRSDDEQHEAVVAVLQIDERRDALPLDASLPAWLPGERGVLEPALRAPPRGLDGRGALRAPPGLWPGLGAR